MKRTLPVLLLGLLCALCALGGLAVVVAGAAPGRHPHAARHTARHRPRACLHRHRRRCHRSRRSASGTSRRQRHAAVGAAPTTAGSGSAANPTPAGATATPTTSAGAAGGSAVSGSGSTGAGAGGETSSTEETSSTGTAPARVQVIAREYSFTLSRAEVPAGKVIVEFVNGGEDQHNLHLAEPAEGTEAGSFPTSEPGTHADLTLNMHPGTYTLFCSLPGHEAKGMKATLTVK